MTVKIREVKEGTQYQGADEELAYQITTTNWGSSPSSTAVKAYDENNADDDVTSTVFPTNSPSESGDVITLSPLKSMTIGHSYRIEVKFTDGDSNIWELFFIVKCVEK